MTVAPESRLPLLRDLALGALIGLTLALLAVAVTDVRWPYAFEGAQDALLAALGSALVGTLATGLLRVVRRRGGWLLTWSSGTAFGVLIVATAMAAAQVEPSPAFAGSEVGFTSDDSTSPSLLGLLFGPALMAFFSGLAVLLGGRCLRPGAATVTLLGTSLIAIAVTKVVRPPAVPDGSNHPVVLIGLDAANWTVLEREFENGNLPHLKRLVERGTSGTLWSDEPTLSPRVWTTLATGKHPADHGIEDFFCTQNEDLRAARMWEIFSEYDYSVGLFQWLVTWPAEPYDPFLVPGWLATSPSTHPASLSFVKELEQHFQNESEGATRTDFLRWCSGYLEHGLRLRTAFEAAFLYLRDVAFDDREPIAYGAKRRIQLALNRDLYLNLYRTHQPDFSAFICYGTDNIAHKYWKYSFWRDFRLPEEDAEPYQEVLLSYYRDADAALGEFLEVIPQDATVLVVSDHGFTSFPAGEPESDDDGPRGAGYLVYKPRMDVLASLLDVRDRTTAEGPAETGIVNVATRGYFSPKGTQDQRDAVGRRVLDGLAAIQRANDGAPLFLADTLPTGEIELRIDPAHRHEKDVLLRTAKGPRRVGDLVVVESRSGGHSTEGIWIANGPGFRSGSRVDAHLVDILPTLLAQQGFPTGDDMAGRVVADAFLPGFDWNRETLPSYDALIQRNGDSPAQHDEVLRARLRAAGYLTDDSGDDG